MANHSSGNGKRKYQQPPAEDRYGKLELAKQLAAYQYWIYLVEEGNSKLWNPDQSPTLVWKWMRTICHHLMCQAIREETILALTLNLLFVHPDE